MRGVLLAAVGLAMFGPAAHPQDRPTTDLIIRSQAGLPASSASGDIQLIDVGHNPMSPMVSIVGRRTPGGWHVSYACASSPACDQKHFVLAKAFDLPADAASRLDAVLDRLEAQPEAGDPSAQPNTCGRMTLAIKDRGFRREYRRTCSLEKDLRELEALLKAGLP